MISPFVRITMFWKGCLVSETLRESWRVGDCVYWNLNSTSCRELVSRPGWWPTATTRDRWHRYQQIRWWFTIDAGIINWPQTEDQQWSRRKLQLNMYLSTGWWSCRNGKKHDNRGCSHCSRYKDACDNEKISNTWKVSASTSFRSRVPSRRPNCQISLLNIHIWRATFS